MRYVWSIPSQLLLFYLQPHNDRFLTTFRPGAIGFPYMERGQRVLYRPLLLGQAGYPEATRTHTSDFETYSRDFT